MRKCTICLRVGGVARFARVRPDVDAMASALTQLRRIIRAWGRSRGVPRSRRWAQWGGAVNGYATTPVYVGDGLYAYVSPVAEAAWYIL